MKNTKSLLTMNYLLLIIGVIFGFWPSVIALIISYLVIKPEGLDEIEATMYQRHTILVYIAWTLIGAITIPLLIGIFILLIINIYLFIKSIIGLSRVQNLKDFNNDNFLDNKNDNNNQKFF